MTFAEAVETLRQLRGRAELLGEFEVAAVLLHLEERADETEVVDVATQLKAQIPEAFPS